MNHIKFKKNGFGFVGPNKFSSLVFGKHMTQKQEPFHYVIALVENKKSQEVG